jgi:anti-sigma factor RsiW
MTDSLQPVNDDERDDIVAYLDGELPPAAARAVESKLQVSASIRAEADAFKRTWDLLDYLPRPGPSASFTHRTLERVSVMQPRIAMPRRMLPWRLLAFGVGWAAALVVAGAVGFASVGPRTPPREPADEELARDLRVIENKKLYERVEDLDFLKQLDNPELFGDDIGG